MQSNIRKYLPWLKTLPFLFAICTVFANDPEIINGVVLAKYAWFYMAMAFLLPVIPFLKLAKPSLIDGLVLSFGIVVVLVTLLSSGPLAHTKLVLFMLLLILYWLLRCLLTSHPKVAGLITVGLIATALAQSLLGMHQWYGFSPSNNDHFKITGSFFNPGPFSGYVGMIVPLALHEVLLFINKEARLRRQIRRTISKTRLKSDRLFSLARWMLPYAAGSLSLLTVIAVLIVLPAANSRAAWVGVVLGCLIVLLNNPSIRQKVRILVGTRQRRIGAITLLSALIIVASVGTYKLRPESVDGRILLWRHGMKAVIEQPFGVGLGKTATAIGKMQADFYSADNIPQALIKRADIPSYVFNEYIEIGVEAGIPAIIIFLVLMGVVLSNAYKEKKYGAVGSLVCLSVFAFFSYPFNILPFDLVLVFFLALIQVKKNKTETSGVVISVKNDVRPKASLQALLVSMVFIVLIASSLVNRLPIIQAWKTWKASKVLVDSHFYFYAAEMMTPLYTKLNDQPEFLYDYANCLSKAGRYMESNQVLVRCMSFCSDPMLYNKYGYNLVVLGQNKEAETAFKYSYNMVPNRLYPLYLLTKLYAKMGDTLSAKQTADKFNNHVIIVPSKAIEEMKDSIKALMKTMP